MTTLTRRLISQVIREEAAKTDCDFEDVLHISSSPEAVAARRAAIRRLTSLTQCRPPELARAWGCDVHTVRAALVAGGPSEPLRYDFGTTSRLRWAHGDERAAEIINGRDQPTQQDIAAWRRLCARSRIDTILGGRAT